MSIFSEVMELAGQSTVFAVLIFTIMILLLVAVGLAFYTFYLRYRNNKTKSRWERLEAEWEPELLEILSGAEGPRTLWKRVRRKDMLYFVEFLFRYAKRLHGEEKELLAELARPFLKYIASRSRGGDPERRARAVQTLCYLGLNTYSDVIIEALDAPSPLVAMSAARSLAHKDHPEYIDYVLDKLHRFEHWSPSFLASMLSSVGITIAPKLQKIFVDIHRPPWVRAVASEALRELNALNAADDAAWVLETEANRNMFTSALRLLGRIGRPEHLPRIRSLCRSPDFVVRLHAINALSNLGSREDLPTFLEAFKKDPSRWVALRAAWGLKANKGTEILQEIANSSHRRAELAQQVLRETEQ